MQIILSLWLNKRELSPRHRRSIPKNNFENFFEYTDLDEYVNGEPIDPLETGQWLLATNPIDFNCYMSGGRILYREEGPSICVHDDDDPCNFVYHDANGDE